jgi:DNA replication protein DnaC
LGEGDPLLDRLKNLRLPFFHTHCRPWAAEAAQKSWPHLDYLSKLVDGECNGRKDRTTQRRLLQARFPVAKSLENFRWDWPKKINRLQIQHLFHLDFIGKKETVVFLGGPGLGKTHLSIALGQAACLRGYRVLFATTMDVINSLTSAKQGGYFGRELARYSKPDLLILDELGFLPLDKWGADVLFQIVSRRYERAAMVITTNKAFKEWATIFNNDATITSAILDRILHHATTNVIEGRSFRMKDRFSD